MMKIAVMTLQFITNLRIRLIFSHGSFHDKMHVLGFG